MALDPTFSVSIDSDRTTITITDSTTYGTGGNPARADLAVYFNAYKMSYENEATTLTVTSDDDDPTTDSQWSYAYDTDGWYKHYYVAIPDYNIATTYAQYDAVYSAGAVYRSLVGSNTGQSVNDTSYWEPISDPATLANNEGESNESANITSTIYQRVFTSNGQYAYGNLIREQCLCTDCDESELMQRYATFSLWINGAVEADQRTEVLTGERICRRIESTFIDTE